MQLFGERFGNFIVAACAIPAAAGFLLYAGIVATNVAEARRNAGAIGGFYVRAAAAKQGVALAAAEPLAYVRDDDHNILIGPLPLSAAKAKAQECCDQDGVEIIDETMPAYAEVDESVRAKVALATRNK